MKVTQPNRLLAALSLACALGFAPLAMAQMAPSGTMAPMGAPAVKPATGKLPKTDEFSTTTAAAAHCPKDTVVWSALTKSKSFHVAGSRYFGKTKHGAYVCKGEALSYGFHQAKS
jgi:hypothetical protein